MEILRRAVLATVGSCVTMTTARSGDSRPAKISNTCAALAESERARRLVGQHHQRVGDDGPGQGHPLLLATRHLDGPVVDAGGQPEPVERRQGTLAPLLRAQVAVEERRLDVAQRGQVRDEVELLEDEADGIAPELGAGRVVEQAHVLPGNADGPRRGQVEDPEQAQHGRLPRARGPHDRHELAGEDLQRDVAQRVDLHLLAVDARDRLQLEEGRRIARRRAERGGAPAAAPTRGVPYGGVSGPAAVTTTGWRRR